ncbi:hypothetical protein PMZ80_007595 [Knufia obscura]|uniref:Heterokaryon incompatibility domain-containing protein n=2 Tax=Knufia TaxID=430999 RepID=A0AAN8EF40_9EURO|nr:hypothetical protein PMZ80_007595 [Knufia obscura]KAK5954138.1 hypothetical protein OHC33_004710 [Knufia fluminis]
MLGTENGFKQEPLPHPITHVRLLEIQPQLSTQDVAIRCRLRSVRLTEYDQCYTALSYTWDDNDTTRCIFINNQEVKVQSNLYELLSIYRQKLTLRALPTVFLWVDAICLDHSNIRERNSQVQIMPNIFQRAKTVLAWLEPLSGVAQTAGDGAGLEKFVHFLDEIKKDIGRPQNFHNDRHLVAKYVPSSSPSACRFADQWRTMLQICRHHYWSRLWVLQENRFAQNLMFMYGDVLWSWDDFRAPFVLMSYLLEWQIHDLNTSGGLEPAQILHTAAVDVVKSRLVFERPNKFLSISRGMEADFSYADTATERSHLTSVKEPLSDLLKAHRHRLCSERLDKVYALIGLSDSSLMVDYARSNIELFCAVLLSLKVSFELNFVSILAHHLEVSAFQYRQHRRSMIKDAPATMADQSAADVIGRDCNTVYSVSTIPARTEISDIMQARLGIQDLRYFRITAQQGINEMRDWNDFPQSHGELPRIHGHTPGTQMPIVDGFDLSDTSFRGAMFLNPSSRSSKALFGMISTDIVTDGDILVTEGTVRSGIIMRISGLRKTWLTVIGVVLFARRVTVQSDSSNNASGLSASPTDTIRSTASLSEFCEHTCPTAFTITGCDDKENFTLRPHDIQLAHLLNGSRPRNGGRSAVHSRSSSRQTNVTTTSMASYLKKDDNRSPSKTNRFDRFLDVISPLKRSHSK